MGGILTSFIFAVGAAAWVYNKSQQRNGGLTQQSLIAAGVSGVAIFIIVATLLATLLN